MEQRGTWASVGGTVLGVGVTISGVIWGVEATRPSPRSVWSITAFRGGFAVACLGALILLGVIGHLIYTWVASKPAPGVAVPSIELHALEPKLIKNQWYCRLRVENLSDSPETFYAKVEEVEGAAPSAPEPPWWVTWRNSSHRDQLIPAWSSELLNLAVTLAKEPEQEVDWWPSFTFRVALAGNGDTDSVHVVMPSNTAVLGAWVKVWHKESGQAVAEQRLMLRLNVDDDGSTHPSLAPELNASGEAKTPKPPQVRHSMESHFALQNMTKPLEVIADASADASDISSEGATLVLRRDPQDRRRVTDVVVRRDQDGETWRLPPIGTMARLEGNEVRLHFPRDFVGAPFPPQEGNYTAWWQHTPGMPFVQVGTTATLAESKFRISSASSARRNEDTQPTGDK